MQRFLMRERERKRGNVNLIIREIKKLRMKGKR